MNTDPARLYRISFLQPARERIKRCAQAATGLGIAQEYAATLRVILDRLAREPAEWGDPYKRLHAAKLLIYKRLYNGLYVEYAVHEEARVVFVRDCRPVLDHPLKPFA